MKKMLLAAGALLAAGLGQTSCQAPVQPAPKSEPIDAVRPPSAGKPAPIKSATPAVAPRQVALRQAPLMPASFVHFIEKPHRRKVKYGRSKWIIL